MRPALTGPAVEALARSGDLSLAQITDAVAARDYPAGFAYAIAHLVAGRELPIDVVAPLFEGDPEPYILLHVAGKATGDRATVLLDLIDRGRVPYEDTIIAMLFVAWRTAADRDAIRPHVIRTLRRALTDLEDDEIRALTTLLVDELGDEQLARAAKLIHGIKRDKKHEKIAAGTLTEPISELVSALPLEAPAKNKRFTVRAVEKVGRNDLCPCGSGKKYKKCCADKEESAASPLGTSWDAYLREGAATMSQEDVQNLEYADLVQVDLTKLAFAPLVTAARRFTRVRDWEYAHRALDAIAIVKPDEMSARVEEAMHEALEARDLVAARALRARIPEADRHPATEEWLAILAHEATLDLVEASARRALASDSPVEKYELAFSLLKGYPALGILVGRDLVTPEHILDAETMYFALEQAAAALDAPVDERIDERWRKIVADYRASQKGAPGLKGSGRRGRKQDPAKAAERKAKALQSSLVAENERASRLERELAAAREALAGASKPVATQAANDPAPSADALRAMRDRVQTLEAQIREGNEERAELRRKLETTPKPVVAPKPAAPAVEEDDPGDEVDSRGRRVMVPFWHKDALRSIESLPSTVAALAITTAGELAAADDAAWHQVKQARDMSAPVYMARVGIHHRLIFEVRDGRFEVLDVITRETLLHVLKRLRAR